MRKKKIKYSLTAKERKQQYKTDMPEETLTEQEREARDEKVRQKKESKRLLVRIISIVMASVIAVSAITVGVVLLVLNSKIDNEEVNPVLTITLQDAPQSQIKIELLYKESIKKSDEGEITDNGRASIANLIYLAENKFFDNTIFTNSANGFLAMEGYTALYTHKGQDEDYVAGLKGFKETSSNKWGEADFKLGYRITRKTIISAPSQKEGYMAMFSGISTWGSSTGYIMMYDNSPNLSVNGTKFETNLTYMGRLEKESIDVLKQIAAMSTTSNEKVNGWKFPNDYESVKIKTVRVSNLNKDLKKKIMNSFEKYVLEKESEMDGAIKGLNQWRDRCNQY